jgi:acetate kinase
VRVLVVNAGSSSLKLSVLDGDELVLAESVGGRDEEEELRDVFERAGDLDAVGHRVVHGGTDFVEPVVLDDAVLARLRELTDLAPLHQPKSLRAIELVTRLLPEVPAAASFDTAFHGRLPPAASTYALPVEWRTRWPLRRFGFHGLSHAYVARRAAELAARPVDELRVVSCHLGAGASLAAIAGGRSVDTTMGFTPLEGLVMATRSGSVDPGLVLWLQEHAGMPAAELAATLEHRSGLLALAGTADMKAALEAEAAGNERAALAVGVYVHRLRAAIAAMAAAMDGIDALVFTGGVGEHAAAIRARAAAGLAFLGVELDQARNDDPELDAEVGAARAPARTFVVRAREDLQIARDVRTLFASSRLS